MTADAVGTVLFVAGVLVLVWGIQWYVASRRPAEAPDAVDAVHDGYQRAAWFTPDEATQLQSTAGAPCLAYVRVSAMNEAQVCQELAAMTKRGLSDLRSAPARLEEFYVAPEVQQ